MKKYVYLVFICLFFLQAKSQNKYKPTLDLVREAYSSSTSKDYKDAIELYSKVNENDDLYLASQYEKSLCLFNDEQYDTCIIISKEILKSDKTNFDYSLVYNNIGISYLALKNYKEAIKYIDEGLVKYPKYYLLHYNKAIALRDNQEYQLAIDAIKKCIYYNPYYANAHYVLGKLAGDEGMLVQAMLATNTAIYITADDTKALGYVKYLNTLLSKKYESKENMLSFSDKGDDFASIEEIIRAQAALNSKYKLETDIDFPFARQNQALFSYLQEHSGTDGYFEKTYIPFYKEIYSKKYFNAFTNLCVLTTDNTALQSKIKKNLPAIKEFYGWSGDEFLYKFCKRKVDEIETDVYFYYKDGKFDRIGTLDENQKATGKWIYVFNNGLKRGIGFFKDGKSEGEWITYYQNGNKMELQNFSDDKLNGPYEFYFDNGSLKIKANYINDSIDGIFEQFNIIGAKISMTTYKNGQKEGPAIDYYPNGEKKLELTFVKSKADGDYIGYYPNGKKEFDSKMKNSFYEGAYTRYFVDGSINKSFNYKEGYKEGPYKIYYRNGQLRSEGTYKKNNLVGTCKSYYANGQIEEIYEYDIDGNESGVSKDYDYDGKLYSEISKTKKKILSLKYFDKSGTMYYESKVKDGSELNIYRPDGSLLASGKVKSNSKDGMWHEYFRDGSKSSSIEYVNGAYDGLTEVFYANGKLKSYYYYKRDSLVGTFKKYYINGTMSNIGNYYDDHVIGEYSNYYKNGTRSSTYFYNDEGDLNGEYTYYDSYGKPYNILSYKEGFYLKEYYLDSTGKKLNEYYLKPTKEMYIDKGFSDIQYSENEQMNGIGNGSFKLFKNKLLVTTGNFINNRKEGIWTWKGVLDSISAVYSYELGSREGIQKDYTVDGKLYAEFSTLEDEYHGKFIRYYMNGAKQYESDYIYGVEHGVKTYYALTGEKIMQAVFNNDDIVKFIVNGSKELSDTIDFKTGTGSITANYLNGGKAIELHLKNGLFDSTYAIYNKDGKPLYESFNKDDQFQGERKLYYPSGKLYISEMYIDDDLNGDKVIYRENGTKKAIIPYFNDSINGDIKIFDNTGKLIETRTYYNDNLLNVKKY
jgi:antitoxin component YwqK of YwqJK toxin-antitoxin module